MGFPTVAPRPNGGGAARAMVGSHQCDQRARSRAMGPAGGPDSRVSTVEYKLVIMIAMNIKFPSYPSLLREKWLPLVASGKRGDE